MEDTIITLTINGKEVSVPKGTSILNAAKSVGIKIPSLCYNPDLPAWASCGICIVHPVGSARMMRACCTEVTQGMDIITHDPAIVQARRTVLELILSNHPDDCLTCSRNGNCELQSLAAEFGLRTIRFDKILKNQPVDDSNEAIVLDRNKCINCGRCVEACQVMQNVWALEYTGRGDKTIIGPVAGNKLSESPCIRCGQCAVHCPVGAIYSTHSNRKIWDRLGDKNYTSVVQIAPAVRVALGEEFDLPTGSITTGKIYTALKKIGFDYVFDTNFSADLTIMEEGTEFVNRFTKNEAPLPLFTSCCPSWVDYCEKNYHDLLPNLSTAKSPQQMMGAAIKTYWAQNMKLDPNKIFSMSIMPCTAKKWELQRDEHMSSSGAQRDVDTSITTREFARLIRQAGIDFDALEESKADSPLGQYTGAGTIFGVTGGVMEAALRSAYKLITDKELDNIELSLVRGFDGVKEGKIDINGIEVRVCIIHQLSNVEPILEKIRKEIADGTEPSYHFIEVMACRGGCIGGGGQPYGVTDEIRAARAKALYSDDEKSTIRVSHKNPDVIRAYKDFFIEPCGEKSHHLLHTSYIKRPPYAE